MTDTTNKTANGPAKVALLDCGGGGVGTGYGSSGREPIGRVLVELPIQRATREDLLAGMCGIIRRMTRLCGPHPQTGLAMLCLCDHDERALAIELFSYLEGVKNA